MPEQNKANVDAMKFEGLDLTTDPHDLEPGHARDQVNVMSSQDGLLQTRRGYRFVAFEDD